MVAQLAYQYGIYVIYFSLALEILLQYPERSTIANILPLGKPKSVSGGVTLSLHFPMPMSADVLMSFRACSTSYRR